MISRPPHNPDLATELLDRVARATEHWDRRAHEQLDGVRLGQGRHDDYANAKRLLFVITQYGWPGHQLVGQDAARAAWRIALHADDHPSLQTVATRLMRHAADRGDASLCGWAHLHDRTSLNRLRHQDFGTQYKLGRAGPEVCPTRDPASLDTRRAAVGLPPAAAGLAAVRARLAPSLTDGTAAVVTVPVLADVA